MDSFKKFEVFDKEFRDYQHAFLKKVDQYYANCTKNENSQDTKKMIKKYKEFQYNLAICTIVYTLFYKNKKNFFIFFKPWYNWYKLKR